MNTVDEMNTISGTAVEIDTSIVIEVKELTKSFRNNKVLDNINFSVKKGTICGIVGRNGSGKTVLFRCICGFMQPDKGEILIDGEVTKKGKKPSSNIGVIIESPGFLRHYSGYKNLEFLASLNSKPQKKDLEHVLQQVGLYEERNKKVGKYSMGMRQRLGIAQAIMEHQEILILDEPMNGLDNQGVADMRKLLLELKAHGTTILLASHNKDDIQQLCDRVFEMDHGILSEASETFIHDTRLH